MWECPISLEDFKKANNFLKIEIDAEHFFEKEEKKLPPEGQ